MNGLFVLAKHLQGQHDQKRHVVDTSLRSQPGSVYVGMLLDRKFVDSFSDDSELQDWVFKNMITPNNANELYQGTTEELTQT